MKAAFPRFYAILSAELPSTKVDTVASALADAGVELIQYRDKNSAPRTVFENSLKIAAALARKPVRFIVNDRPDVARLCGAGGVHVGQEDLPVEDARAICCEASPHAGGASRFWTGFWVGVSTHTLEQVRDAEKTSADYIAIGPIFPTSTKEKPDPVVGMEFIRLARRLTKKPLVAIGGITLALAPEVFLAGADCVAVAQDLIGAANPAERAREYLTVSASCCS